MLKLLNFVMGICSIVLGILIFMIVGSLVDGLSISTFIRWACMGFSLIALGALMYKLSEVDK